MTQTMEWKNVDKSEWPAGPWHDEPDKRQWQDVATGLPCLIVRNRGGALCGYAGVSNGHPLHGKGYGQDGVFSCGESCSDEDGYHYGCTPEARVEVHGGLTFSAGCGHGADPAEGICHVPAAGQPDDVWWFGFDCAHSGDLCPAPGRFIVFPGEVYRDIAYVTGEVTRLAAQLATLRP